MQIVDTPVVLDGEDLVSWCFEPSQPQRSISGRKTNANPSPNYSARKPLNHSTITEKKKRGEKKRRRPSLSVQIKHLHRGGTDKKETMKEVRKKIHSGKNPSLLSPIPFCLAIFGSV